MSNMRENRQINYMESLNDFIKSGKWNEAYSCIKPALKQYPEKKDTIFKALFLIYLNLGVNASNRHEHVRALEFMEKAKEISPMNYQLMNHIGNVYSNMNDFERARHFFTRAIAFKPDFIMAYVNLAYVSHRLGEHARESALTEFVLKVDPDNLMANWHHALWCLLRGDYLLGWKEYRWRFKHPIFIKQNKTGLGLEEDFFSRYWTGQKMAGKNLMVFSEQGFGDFIQFCRYLPLLKRRKIKVHVACLKELIPLIQHWKCLESVQPIGGQYPKYDRHVYILSLPEIFKTTLDTIPKQVPYITVPNQVKTKWAGLIKPSQNLKVGICCTGNQNTVVSKIRSCQLSEFAPIFDLKGIDFYNLHVKDKPPNINDYPLIDVTDGVKDFMDTAGLIKNLDLIISVETAVAHLAGALGKPLYVVLAKTPAWRWLLDREDSPWYPSARLFRQTRDREWADPIQRMIQALQTDYNIG